MSHFEQFYVHPGQVHGDCLFLAQEEFVHAVRVLRKKEGDLLTAVDGHGWRYQGRIQTVSKDQLKVAIEQKDFNAGEPRFRLTLAQAVPKGSQFDWVIEKGTEIGISAFLPIITERSIVDPTSRIGRWQQKALAAMKQCGRSRCPEVRQVSDFCQALADRKEEIAFIAHEALDPAMHIDLAFSLNDIHDAILYVGPEGGFTDEEFRKAMEAGARPLSLGSRRLRSETAGLVGAIKLLSAAGDLG
jgi:16S rRNA (uracil1498-N3)-methyltransferase